MRRAINVSAMAIAPNETKDELSFGPFQLLVRERLLTKEGTAVDLGARTLDLLIALISSPNEVVSKQDLMSRVWPDVIVEEGSLRFHMNGLRKALGDGKDGARYIATLPGRGYCFVASVSRPGGSRDAAPANFSACQSSEPPEQDGRPGGRCPHAVDATDHIAPCHHRRLRRGRQNHGRGRGLRPAACLRPPRFSTSI